MKSRISIPPTTELFEADSGTARHVSSLAVPSAFKNVLARSSTLVGLVMAAAWVSALLGHIAGPQSLFYGLVTFTAFALPGPFIGMVLFGTQLRKHPESLIFGTAIGFVLNEFLSLLIGYEVGWSVSLIFLAMLLLTGVSAIASWHYRNHPWLPLPREWDRRDYQILMAMTVALLAFVTLPFWNFGKLTQWGYSFTWLFGFDFILRSSYAASITLALPPDFLHLTGNFFHYYLVSYTAPALAFSASGKLASLNSLLLLYALVMDVLFLACLYSLLRHFILRHRALVVTVVLAMAAYSYYGWYVVVKHFETALPHSLATLIRAHGLLDYGDVSHLFQRLFLVEPQAVTGLCVIIAILFVLELIHYRIERYEIAILLGLLLGIEFGVDALIGLVVITWFGLVYALQLLRAPRESWQDFGKLAITVSICGLVCFTYFAVGMYSFADGGQLYFESHAWLLTFWPVYLPIEFGPMLLLGCWGLVWLWRSKASRISRPLLLLVAVIFLQVLILRVGVLPRERMAERVLPIILLIWSGQAFERWFDTKHSLWGKTLMAMLVLAAVPTFFTDIRYTSDVEDPTRTAYVNVSDMKACEWIQRNLPETAVLQGESSYSGYPGAQPFVPAISLIPDFAQRRTVLGERYVASTTLARAGPIVLSREKDLKRMFEASSLDDVSGVTNKYGIDYLYVDPQLDHRYGRFMGLLETAPNRFREVYSSDGVHIFRVTPTMPKVNAGDAHGSAGLARPEAPSVLRATTPPQISKSSQRAKVRY